MEKKRKKGLKIALIIVASVIVVLLGGFYVYTLDYYRADSTATAALMDGGMTVVHQGSDIIFYPPKDKAMNTGFVFYPGGKVESSAYAPLLKSLAEAGVTCVLVTMPFNLAVFDINAGDRAIPLLPEIKSWYVGGHSLGGAMASSFGAKNSQKLGGMVLLAAYPVTETALPTLAIYGSEDKVLHRDKLAGVKNLLQIQGGNHAQFGNYGIQAGDGTATITREDQQAQTVQAMLAFMKANG